MTSIEIRIDRDRALEYLRKLQAGEPLPAIRGSDDAFAVAGAALFVLGAAARSDPHFTGVAGLHPERREAKEVECYRALMAAASWCADLAALLAHDRGPAVTAPVVRAVVEPADDASPPAYALRVLDGVDVASVRAIASARDATGE